MPPKGRRLQRLRGRDKSTSDCDDEPKGRVVWRDGTEVRRLVAYVPPDVMVRFRARCAGLEATMSAVVTDMLTKCLDEGDSAH